ALAGLPPEAFVASFARSNFTPHAPKTAYLTCLTPQSLIVNDGAAHISTTLVPIRTPSTWCRLQGGALDSTIVVRPRPGKAGAHRCVLPYLWSVSLRASASMSRTLRVRINREMLLKS